MGIDEMKRLTPTVTWYPSWGPRELPCTWGRVYARPRTAFQPESPVPATAVHRVAHVRQLLGPENSPLYRVLVDHFAALERVHEQRFEPGLLIVAAVQKLSLWNRVVLAWIGTLTAAVAALVWHFAQLPQAEVAPQSAVLANSILIALVASFLLAGAWRRVPLYETFIEGAKEGFGVAIGIVPYLVAILVAVGVLRASGALEAFLGAIKAGVGRLSMDTRWVDALPTALIKPLSGGGARGMMVDTMKALGADSFAGRLSCVIQGSTETTFYVLAVYFGSVGVRKTRHALGCALATEMIGVLAAIGVTYLFFG